MRYMEAKAMVQIGQKSQKMLRHYCAKMWIYRKKRIDKRVDETKKVNSDSQERRGSSRAYNSPCIHGGG